MTDIIRTIVLSLILALCAGLGNTASAQYSYQNATVGQMDTPYVSGANDFHGAFPGAFNRGNAYQPGFMQGAPYGAVPGYGAWNWYEGHPNGPGWEYQDAARAAYDPCYGSSVRNPNCRGFGAVGAYPIPFGVQPYGYGYGQQGGINIQIHRQTIQQSVPQQYAAPRPRVVAPQPQVLDPFTGPDQLPVAAPARENTYVLAAERAVRIDLSGLPDTLPSGAGRDSNGSSRGSGVDREARKRIADLKEEFEDAQARLCDAEARSDMPLTAKCKAK